MPVNKELLMAFMEKEKSRKSASYDEDGKKFFYIKEEGDHYVRVLDIGNFVVGQHWGLIEPQEGKKAPPIYCPRLYSGSPCPACEIVEELKLSKDPEDQKRAKSLEAKAQYPILLLDLNEEGTKGLVPRIYTAPYTVFSGISKYIMTLILYLVKTNQINELHYQL